MDSHSKKRVFLAELEERALPQPSAVLDDDQSRALVAAIREGVVGADKTFESPFGQRPIVYADWTASGRALAFVERHIQEEVMPMYANTHTSTSVTGLQSTCFRHEARQIIAQSVNATTKEDVVLFTGTGVTGAIAKMVNVLGVARLAAAAEAPDGRPVVFVGPHEHHSNLLPWRESGAEVVVIPEDDSGAILLAELAAALQRFAARPLRVGSFAAASNVTGVLAPVDAITELLHRHGALACWDYATAAPYVPMDMNPVVAGAARPFVYKDAIFISTHKFVGGPGSPGILVVKKRLLANAVPTVPGGGTVFFVSDHDHRYLSNRIEREEGGTPDIVGAVRAGLVFQLKDAVGAARIQQAELRTAQAALERLHAAVGVVPLGPSAAAPRLPILSFLLRAGDSGRFLHHSFVAALLNDLFGVQARAGCMCAGPYAQALLGLSREAVAAVEAELLDKRELLRPGFTRVALPYFMSEAEVDYVLKAIEFLGRHGWRLLPLYRFHQRSGEWKHESRFTKFPQRSWLGHFTFQAATGTFTLSKSALQPRRDSLEAMFKQALKQAEALVAQAATLAATRPCPDQTSMLSARGAALRWFLFPSEAADALLRESAASPPLRPPAQPLAGSGAVRPRAYNAAGEPEPAEAPSPAAPATAATAATAATVATVATADTADTAPAVASGGEVGYADALDLVSEDGTVFISRGAFAPRNDCTSCASGACPDTHASKRAATSSTSAFSLDVTAVGAGAGADAAPAAAPTAAGATAAPASMDVDPVKAAASRDRRGARPGAEKFPSRAAASADAAAPSAAVAADTAASTSARAQLFPKLPAKIMRQVGRATLEWDMIRDGDRLLLGLSGGKDSLTLLHVLHQLQRRAPVRFELAAATVDPGTSAFDPSPLIPYMKSLGIRYFYLRDPIFDRATSNLQGSSICSYCARMKRGLLYTCCRREGYNVLVLAQHLDDLCESTVMSLFHNGTLRTMKANYTVAEGDIRVIRPLAYTREFQTKQFAYAARLPVINENCPACFEAPKERARVKRVLAEEEAAFPIFSSMLRAIKPLMNHDVERLMCEEAQRRDRMVPQRRPQGARAGNGKAGGVAGAVGAVDADGADAADATGSTPAARAKKRTLEDEAPGGEVETAAAVATKRRQAV